MAGRFLRAWKWAVLLRAKDIPIGTWQALRMSWISHFTGSWTPGQIGGDAYRLYALREFGKAKDVLSTLILERYAGLWSVSLFVVVGLPWTVPYLRQVSPWTVPILLGLVLVVLAILPCLLSRRLLDFVLGCIPLLRNTTVEMQLRSFYGTMADYRHHSASLACFSLAAVAEVVSYFVLNFLSAKALGLDVSLVYFLFAMPVVHLLLRIPVSVQALGIQEGCFAYALALHGFQPAEGLAVSVVQRCLEWIVAIVPGGLLLCLPSNHSWESSTEGADAQSQLNACQSSR